MQYTGRGTARWDIPSRCAKRGEVSPDRVLRKGDFASRTHARILPAHTVGAGALTFFTSVRLGVTPARTAAAAIGEKVAAASGQPGVAVPVESKRCHARDCAPHDWPIGPDRTCVRPGAVVLGARRVHFAARAFVQRAPALCC
jgi:hypothetical protein